PAEQLEVLLEELGAYRPDLLERERVVVGSRADLAEDGADAPVELRISAVTGEGIARLRGRLADAVRAARAELPEPTQFVVHRPASEGFRIVRDGAEWVVEGRQA